MALTIRYLDYTFTIHDVKKLPNMYRAVDLTSQNLEFDTFNFGVKSDAVGESKIFEGLNRWLLTVDGKGIIVDDGDLTDFVYGTPVYIYEDGVQKDIFYVKDIYLTNERDRDREIFKIECMSLMGILSRIPHLGDVYSGTRADVVIASIMGNLPYTIDSDIARERIDGHLPAVKDARKNLNKVLFALGGMLLKNANGSLRISYSQPTTAVEIPKSRTFYTGINEKLERRTSVTLVEHGYFQSQYTQEEVAYDNSTGTAVSNSTVIFDEPWYAYRGDGITIHASGANWARISGSGVLYAKKYIHTQRENTEIITTEGEENPLQISDQTLVSALNVNGIMTRLVNYYSNAKIRTAEFLMENERPGDFVDFYDRRGNELLGYIKSVDESASSFWRGKVQIVTNWAPTEPGNDFNEYRLYQTAQTVTVPTEARGKAGRFVLMGGFCGGQGGSAGESGQKAVKGPQQGTYPNAGYPYEPGKGGTHGGRGGQGGRGVMVKIVDIASMPASFTINQIGAGGQGGAPAVYGETGALGSLGGNTIITVNGTQYSSATGDRNNGGFVNFLDGTFYNYAGANGYDNDTGIGGDGNPSNARNSGGSFTAEGTTWTGGKGGRYSRSGNSAAWGGGGGGAAYGANGHDGGDGRAGGGGNTGRGGNGATPVQPSQAPFPYCGQGGHGGGCGGGGGGAWQYYGMGDMTEGSGGPGGSGSQGGQGANGAVLWYF